MRPSKGCTVPLLATGPQSGGPKKQRGYAMVVFLCVACYQCRMFQAIQQKKSSNKFTCARAPPPPPPTAATPRTPHSLQR